jgi:hypothetical protein
VKKEEEGMDKGAHALLGAQPDLLAASEIGISDPPLSPGLGPEKHLTPGIEGVHFPGKCLKSKTKNEGKSWIWVV